MSEFEHWISVDDIKDEPLVLTIEASEEQRAAVAKRLKVQSVDVLTAEYTLSRIQGFVIQVDGHLKADVTQKCVVTLDPVVSHIEERYDGYYADQTEAISFAKAKRDHIVNNTDPEVSFLDERDDPEPTINGKIDLGELAVQYLSLSINPYPHKEGVTHDLTDADEEAVKAAMRPENPFAALKDLKEKLDKD